VSDEAELRKNNASDSTKRMVPRSRASGAPRARDRGDWLCVSGARAIERKKAVGEAGDGRGTPTLPAGRDSLRFTFA